MERREITDNRLIAEFMQDQRALNVYRDHKYLPSDDTKYVRYHNSWDWLMPVVEAIEELEEPHPSNNPEKGTIWPYQFEILSRQVVQIIDNRNDASIISINQDGLTKIQSVYKAVVAFIRWYNSQTPDK